MASVRKCLDCEQKRYVNYTGCCKRCNTARGKKAWLKNKMEGVI